METLDGQRADIYKRAGELGLVVYPSKPDPTRRRSIVWDGGWEEFLDLGARVAPPLLYVEERRYDREAIVDRALGGRAAGGKPIGGDDESRDADERLLGLEAGDEAEDGDADLDAAVADDGWRRHRLVEAVAPWDVHQGELVSLRLIWLREGVAHVCKLGPVEWFADCVEALRAARVQIEAVAKQEQASRDEAEAALLHQWASELAVHPRFAEATNEEKRVFMAEQLFADVLKEHPTIRARSIAGRASLIHWWEVEPAERVTRVERARELYAMGESLRNIAAVLKMPESKVRAAVLGTGEA